MDGEGDIAPVVPILPQHLYNLLQIFQLDLQGEIRFFGLRFRNTPIFQFAPDPRGGLPNRDPLCVVEFLQTSEYTKGLFGEDQLVLCATADMRVEYPTEGVDPLANSTL